MTELERLYAAYWVFARSSGPAALFARKHFARRIAERIGGV